MMITMKRILTLLSPSRFVNRFVLFFSLIFLLTSSHSLATEYYVSAGVTYGAGTGSSGNPWNLKWAAEVANLSAGDIVWVEAGSYTDNGQPLQLNFKHSSSDPNNPISFIGYFGFTGFQSQIPTSYENFKANESLYELIYPVLDGGDRTKNRAITISNKSNLVIKGFYLRNYKNGISASGSRLRFDNVLMQSFGFTTVYVENTALSLPASNSTVYKCFLLNSSQNGFVTKGDSNTFSYCQAYADEGVDGAPDEKASMDYYFLMGISGSAGWVTEGNIFEYCHVGRYGNLDHGGHGFILSTSIKNQLNPLPEVRDNLVRHCTAYRVKDTYAVRGGGVHDNTFLDCTSDDDGHIACSKGAYDNDFVRVKLSSPGSLGAFYLSSSLSDPGTFEYWSDKACVGNRFINCIVENPKRMVIYHSHYDRRSWTNAGQSYPIAGNPERKVENNIWINCTFVNNTTTSNTYLFGAMRANSGNVLQNCVIQGIDYFEGGPFETSKFKGYTPPGYTGPHQGFGEYFQTYYFFESCNFYNNGFSLPTGYDNPWHTLGTIPTPDPNATFRIDQAHGLFRNNISANPNWIGSNYNIGWNSPNRNAGYAVSGNVPHFATDFNGDARVCESSIDIGAQEYNTSACVNSKASIADAAAPSPVELRFYPNPARDFLTVDLGDATTGRVRLIDLSGKVLLQQVLGQPQTRLALGQVPNGVYFLEMTAAETVQTDKVVIAR